MQQLSVLPALPPGRAERARAAQAILDRQAGGALAGAAERAGAASIVIETFRAVSPATGTADDPRVLRKPRDDR